MRGYVVGQAVLGLEPSTVYVLCTSQGRALARPAAQPAGRRFASPQSIVVATYLVSRYSSMPSLPPSRPTPDCLTPPNGAEALDTMPWLRPTMPVSSPSMTRKARLRSDV